MFTAKKVLALCKAIRLFVETKDIGATKAIIAARNTYMVKASYTVEKASVRIAAIIPKSKAIASRTEYASSLNVATSLRAAMPNPKFNRPDVKEAMLKAVVA
jgi:hypothetical protein